jgi:putative SOS response-associated peptidase YedK
MPVVRSPADYDRWLELGDAARPPVDLLRSFDAAKMTEWEVGKDVGSVKNNRPDLIEAIAK